MLDMADPDNQLEQAYQLTARLERLSADSIWARRASGYRASLLKTISRIEALNRHPEDSGNVVEMEQAREHLDALIQNGQQILEMAARDLFRTRTRRTV